MFHTASSRPSFSGAPILTKKGVVGVHLGASTVQGKNRAVSLDFLLTEENDDSSYSNSEGSMWRERFQPRSSSEPLQEPSKREGLQAMLDWSDRVAYGPRTGKGEVVYAKASAQSHLWASKPLQRTPADKRATQGEAKVWVDFVQGEWGDDDYDEAAGPGSVPDPVAAIVAPSFPSGAQQAPLAEHKTCPSPAPTSTGSENNSSVSSGETTPKEGSPEPPTASVSATSVADGGSSTPEDSRKPRPLSRRRKGKSSSSEGTAGHSVILEWS